MRIVLKPHETMKQVKAQDRLRIDAGKVHDAVRNQPGIAGVSAIAHATGLSDVRVRDVIRRINAGETGHVRLDYGVAKARGGPYAGREVRGWFVQDRKAHHTVMDQADEHGALIELGIHRSRLVRYAQAQGIRGADQVVALMLERLGLSAGVVQEQDIETFMELLMAEEADPAA
jgi:hypothetical protein